MNKIPIDELNTFSEYVNEIKKNGTDIDFELPTFLSQHKPTKKDDGKKDKDPYDLEIYEFLEDLEILAYLRGYEAANEMLGSDSQPDASEMNKSIFRKIDGLDFKDRLQKHLENNDFPAIITLANTETERNYNDAVLAAGLKGGAKRKTWHTMEDLRVRDTHSYLEGMTVDISDDFYTFDNDHAPYPGGFEKVGNNANCRCFIDLHK